MLRILFLLASIMLFIEGSYAMENQLSERSFTNANKGPTISLFSAVKGRLTQSGNPIVGARVTRTYTFTWNSKDYVESTMTNEQGEFAFKEATTWMVFGKLLPHEPVIPQEIKAEVNGKIIELWHQAKRNYDTMGELADLEGYIAKTQTLTPMMEHYLKGQIYIECDADSTYQESAFQQLNHYTYLISQCDLQLPYQQGLKQAQQVLSEQSEIITSKLNEYLSKHSEIFDVLSEERFKTFQNAKFLAVESVRFNEPRDLWHHEKDYPGTDMTIGVGAEVIMKVSSENGDQLKARLWLSDLPIRYENKQFEIRGKSHHFIFNEFNIDGSQPSD